MAISIHHILDHRIAGGAQAGIGDKRHLKAVAFSDLQDFRLYRAGIGIDIDQRYSPSCGFEFTGRRISTSDRCRRLVVDRCAGRILLDGLQNTSGANDCGIKEVLVRFSDTSTVRIRILPFGHR